MLVSNIFLDLKFSFCKPNNPKYYRLYNENDLLLSEENMNIFKIQNTIKL